MDQVSLPGEKAFLRVTEVPGLCSAKSILSATFARFSCCNLFQPVFMVQASKDGAGDNSLTTRNSVS
jgi:hypothetical protein